MNFYSRLRPAKNDVHQTSIITGQLGMTGIIAIEDGHKESPAR
jgi:hypothetical protein